MKRTGVLGFCDRKKGTLRGASTSPLDFVPLTSKVLILQVLIKSIVKIGDKVKRF